MIKRDNIKNNHKEISFPRLSGTDDEKRAFYVLKQKVEELNIKPSVQNFTFSTFYSRIYPKIIFSSAFWLLLISFLKIDTFLFHINLAIFLPLFGFLFFLTRKPENIRIGRVLPSQNLFVRLQGKLEKNESKKEINSRLNIKNEKGILLFCHIDSKSQRFPVKIRIFSFKLWLFSYLIGFILIMTTNFFLTQFFLILYILKITFLFMNLFGTILIIFNTTNNESPGALDNGSGITCVLELLTHFSNPETRLSNYSTWFVFTGAEECGTMGIRYFENWLETTQINKEKSIIINLDGIGQTPSYWSSYYNPNYNVDTFNDLQELAHQSGLNLDYTNKTFGVRSDGLYLRHQGFHGFGFGDLQVAKHVHTANDTIDKVDYQVLEKICIFIKKSMNFFDEKKKKSTLE